MKMPSSGKGCIIESMNCEETIETLQKMFYYCCNLDISRIMFQHKKCLELGIAASTIMDTIVMSCKAFRRVKGNEIVISGDYPEDARIRKTFIASGLPEHLENVKTPLFRKDNIRLFKLRVGRHGTKKSDVVSTKLTDYFNECLNTQNLCLTPRGKNQLSKMFGEIVENCEIHGGEEAMWYVLGHYNVLENNQYGEVNLVVFNYGDSIYEQLLDPSTSDETRTKVQYMIQKHKPLFDEQWNEETMLTVFALQGGISRLRDKKIEGYWNRGTGTVRLIEYFKVLGKSTHEMEPEFSVTSGHTHIIIDNKYSLQEESIQDDCIGRENRKIIFFNENNNIFEKADNNNVKYMKQYFPGTIISMKFYIDNNYLSKGKVK